MRRVAALVMVVAVLVLSTGASAVAQDIAPSPAPVTSPAVVQDEGDDSDAKPWGRLLVFVPLSALLGAGVVLGRRTARERGWLQS